MHAHLRLLLAATTATAVLALGAGFATAARSIAVRNGPETITSESRLTFENAIGAWICDVTMGFTLAASTAKVSGTQMGRVTRWAPNQETCRSSFGGSATFTALNVERTEQWHINYESFSGTLPEITGITFWIENSQFLWTVPSLSIQCLFEGRLFMRAGFEARRITSLATLPERTSLALIRDLNRSRMCGTSLTFRGSFTTPRELEIALL